MTCVSDVSQLTVPNDLSYLPVIGAYTRAIAERAGFAAADVHRIRLAVDEACTNVIASFEPGDRQPFTITSRVDSTSLTIAIADKGLPFDPTAVAAYDASGGLDRDTGGLSYYLIKQVMDEVRYLNKGREGKEVRLTKYRATSDVQSYFTAQELQPYEAMAAPADVPIAYRLMRPDEAARVAQCVYRIYGYTYPGEHYYYPERLAEMNRTGEIISAVAVLDSTSGEVVGHCALVGAPDSPIREVGQALVSPPYRDRGIIARLTTLLHQVARERGLAGLYCLPVTLHPYSQRAALALGYRETGLLLGYVPQSVFFKRMEEGELAQRETLLYAFLPLNMPAGPAVYPPPHHREMIQRIYEHVGLTRRLAECPAELSAPAAPANLSTHIKLSLNSAQIEVQGYGDRVAGEIAARLSELRGRGLAVIHLDLPLTDPLTARFCANLEGLGFFFGGVLPGVEKDILRLQYLHDVTIDYDQITCASVLARELLEYIKTSLAKRPGFSPPIGGLTMQNPSASDKPKPDAPPARRSGGTGMFDLLGAADETRTLIARLLRLQEADAATLAAGLDRPPDQVALALEHLVARGEVAKRQEEGRWLYRVVVAHRTSRQVSQDLWQSLDDET